MYRYHPILLAIVLLSCSSRGRTDLSKKPAYSDTSKVTYKNETMWWVYSDSVTVDMNNSAQLFFKNWAADSTGFEFRQTYIDFFAPGKVGNTFLTGLKKVDVIRLMGKPDYENSGKGYITVVEYHMEWGCGNPEYDCCWLSIYFDDKDKVGQVGIGCT